MMMDVYRRNNFVLLWMSLTFIQEIYGTTNPSTAALQFIKFSNTDCLYANNIHIQKTSQRYIGEDCAKWCFDNSDCGGYIVNANVCFFKSTDCKNDIHQRARLTAFIPKFIRFQNQDCLYHKNIHSFHANQHSNYEDCSNWCNDNSNCGGYTVYNNVCYFKSKACKNDLFKHNRRYTFILQSEFIRVQNRDCLYKNNIHSLTSNHHQNYEDCSTWCSDKSHCGGFTVSNNVCYFKNKSCKNNLRYRGGRSTFIPLRTAIPEFIKFYHKDCLNNNNIHSMKLNRHQNYEDCSIWCSDNGNCGGYSVYENVCYFKNKNCKNDMFLAVERTLFILKELIRFQDKDCLYHKNIHSLKSKKQQNYEDCKTWCRVNSHCGGFTAYHGVCYFKSKNCKNDIFGHGRRTTFLLPEFFSFQNQDCLSYFSIHSLPSNEHPDYGDCKKWCQNENRCRGFTVYLNVCYFKNEWCKDNMFRHGGRSTFLL